MPVSTDALHAEGCSPGGWPLDEADQSLKVSVPVLSSLQPRRLFFFPT